MDFRQIATKEASALVASVADRLSALATAEIERQTQRVQKDSETALAALRKEAESALAAARKDADDLTASLKRAGDRIAALESALEESEQGRERGTADLAAATAELTQVRMAVESARKEKNEALAEAAARLQALEQSLNESEALRIEQSRMAREQLANAARVPLDRLRAAFARFNASTTLHQTLHVMVEALATEFARVALFEVAGNKLQGTHHAGFEDAKDVSKLAMPLSVDSVLTEAVRTRRVHGLTAPELAQGGRTLFGGSPTFALAVPIEVRGEVIGVIYADDSDQAPAEAATSDRRVKFTEILLWHAVPLLTRLAVEQAEEEELGEFRKYAAGLLRDLESVYTAEAGVGYAERDLRLRLRHNLDYARRMYAQSIDPEDQVAAGILDHEISTYVSEKRDTPFGSDLAEVAGLDVPAPAVSSNQHSRKSASRQS
jgi:hypothetical protein